MIGTCTAVLLAGSGLLALPRSTSLRRSPKPSPYGRASTRRANAIFRRAEVVRTWATAYKGMGAGGNHTVDLTEHREDGAPDTIVRYTVFGGNGLRIDGLTEAPTR
ncbi:hypothetical protein ACIRP0_32070 [Streptomyces sp. NPDC101733]|uniref:hypothetical protein n=1 Tax=unclassified Streptomyces TaxID=2593676 RepID=UPI0038098D10